LAVEKAVDEPSRAKGSDFVVNSRESPQVLPDGSANKPQGDDAVAQAANAQADAKEDDNIVDDAEKMPGTDQVSAAQSMEAMAGLNEAFDEMADSKIPEEATDDTGADEQLREMRGIAKEKQEKNLEMRKALKKLVAENEEVDADHKSSLQLQKPTPGLPAWATEQDNTENSADEIARDKEGLTELDSQALRNKKATEASQQGSNLARAEEKAEDMKSKAARILDRAQQQAIETKDKAKADALVIQGRANAKAKALQNKGLDEEKYARQAAGSLVADTRKTIAKAAALDADMKRSEAKQEAINNSPDAAADAAADAEADNASPDIPDFASPGGHNPTAKQIESRTEEWEKEEAAIEKMPAGPEKQKLLVEMKEKQETLKAAKAKVRSPSESAADQAKIEANINADAKQSGKEGAEGGGGSLDLSKDSSLSKGMEAINNASKGAASGTTKHKADMKNVAKLVTEEALEDPKALAKKLVKAADTAVNKKETLSDVVNAKSPKPDKKIQAKTANVNADDFVKNKPTPPDPTNIAGVDVSNVPVR